MAFNPNDHLMKLQGKDYLQVAHRLLWLNEDAREGIIGRFDIETELLGEHQWNDERRKRVVREAVYKATVSVFDKDGTMVKYVTGHGSETDADFADYREKAETKAIGRAVALAGYGTQHAPEFDEGERASPFLDKDGNRGPVGPAVVDAPIASSKRTTEDAKKLAKQLNAKKQLNKLPSRNEIEDTLKSKNLPYQLDAYQREETLLWLHALSTLPGLGDVVKSHVLAAKAVRLSDLTDEQVQALSAVVRELLPS